MGDVAHRGNHPVTKLAGVKRLVADQELEGRPVPDVRERAAW